MNGRSKYLDDLDPHEYCALLLTTPSHHSNRENEDQSIIVSGKGVYPWGALICHFTGLDESLDHGEKISVFDRIDDALSGMMTRIRTRVIQTSPPAVETPLDNLMWIYRDFTRSPYEDYGALESECSPIMSAFDNHIQSLVDKGYIIDPFHKRLPGLSATIIFLNLLPMSYAERTIYGDVAEKEIRVILWEVRQKSDQYGEEFEIYIKIEDCIDYFKKRLIQILLDEDNKENHE